jgi:hypothetical protein
MKDRLVVAAVLGAIALLALVVVIVFRYSRHDPSPASLEDTPNAAIPGRVVFVDKDRCIVLAEASGASREELYCGGDISWVSWIDERTVAFDEYGKGMPSTGRTEIDIATRETRDTTNPTQFKTEVRESVNGEIATVEYSGEVYVSGGGSRTEIADFDVPENYGPTFVTWSPDGAWLLLQYSGPKSDGSELWVLSRDGVVRGTLATGMQGWGPQTVSWWVDGTGYLPELFAQPR